MHNAPAPHPPGTASTSEHIAPTQAGDGHATAAAPAAIPYEAPSSWSARSTAGVLLLVMAIGAWQFISASHQLADVPQSSADIRSGKTSLALEKQLNQHLPLRDNLIAAANGMRYLLLRGANGQVRVGRQGWLYLAEEMQPFANANANLHQRIATIKQVQTRLEKDGVKLIVLLVPDKFRLYPQYAYWASYDQARYETAKTALAGQQITLVDPLPALQQAASHEVYYHSDTHWNQRGAQIAAQQVAHLVAKLNLPLDPTEFTLHARDQPSERPGDLLRLMGLEHSPNWLRPQPDLETPLQLEQTSQDPAAGLLDDVSIPVVLTGTSYSLRGQFHGFLQQALHAKVLNAAKDGAGFMQATEAYLNDQAYQSSKPKIVIWEIPERFLPQPLGGEVAWGKKLATR